MSENDETVRRSSLVRVAEFVANIGVGGKFKKLDLTRAVPVSQADRRMRDLRTMGWVIDNYKTNPTLHPDEYLVREVGVRIDQGIRPAAVRRSVAGARRRAIFDRDGYHCQVCGVAAGSEFPDDHRRKAVLTIGHIVPVSRGGTDDEDNLRAECQRCNEESRDISRDPASAAQVLSMASAVGGRTEKLVLYGWMEAGRRTQDAKEIAFTAWARLPRAQQFEVMAALGSQVIRAE